MALAPSAPASISKAGTHLLHSRRQHRIVEHGRCSLLSTHIHANQLRTAGQHIRAASYRLA